MSDVRVAFDLGAESGRALVGTVRRHAARPGGGAPVPEPAGPAARRPLLGRARPVRRDLLRARRARRRQRSRAQRGNRLVGLRFRPARPSGHPDLEPAPSSRRPRRRRDGEGLRARSAGGDLRDDRHPVPAVQHVVPAARSRAERGPAIRGDLPPDPGPAGLLADRRALRRGNEREHDPAPRCRDGPLVGQPDLEARHPRAALRGRARARRGRRRPAFPRRDRRRACRPGRR